MKFFTLVAALTFSLLTALTAQAAEFTFADKAMGEAILTAKDGYFERMGKAELAIRARSPIANVTIEDLRRQYRDNVLDWSSEEIARLEALIESQKTQLASLADWLPERVFFVKVNDQVEGGLPHTRANAIILPEDALRMSDEQLTRLFYHELFHVLSRHQLARHEELYGLLGFHRCDMEMEGDWSARRLTNPDVPTATYYLPVTVNSAQITVAPYLQASRDAFDPELERGFSGHFDFGLLRVEVAEGSCQAFTDENGKAQILDPGMVPDYFTAIGRNTNYIIHAEEVLADNFVYAMINKPDLPNPEIPGRLRSWLNVE